MSIERGGGRKGAAVVMKSERKFTCHGREEMEECVCVRSGHMHSWLF